MPRSLRRLFCRGSPVEKRRRPARGPLLFRQFANSASSSSVYLRQVLCFLGGNPSFRSRERVPGRQVLFCDHKTDAIERRLEEISHVPASPTQATAIAVQLQSG